MTSASAMTLLVIGDSLTAGYQLPMSAAYPALLQQRWQDAGHEVRVINAGVSGDTSAGGAQRTGWLVGRTKPDWVMIALGANDGLRGLPLDQLRENLVMMITAAQEAGSQVILVGMQIPPNLGETYTAGFRAMYPQLAEEFSLPLIPFLLEGVAADPELNLPDGIHPNEDGHRVMTQKLYPSLTAWLFPESVQGDDEISLQSGDSQPVDTPAAVKEPIETNP